MLNAVVEVLTSPEVVGGALVLAGLAVVLWRVSRQRSAADRGRPEVSENRAHALRGHYIVCGYGRVGAELVTLMQRGGVPFVVLDSSPQAVRASHAGATPIWSAGDGTHPDELEAAGLERARGLVACSPADARNAYVTLLARGRRLDLLIVATCSSEAVEADLLVAGADCVVPAPHHGRDLARRLPELQPRAASSASQGQPDHLCADEIPVTRTSEQLGRVIGELRTSGLPTIVAVRKRFGALNASPSTELPLEEGDVIIAVGAGEALWAVGELLQAFTSFDE